MRQHDKTVQRFQVAILQKESRNMDSRVSQLYLQLLHEIINKRDNSLEIQQLENKLLNQTVEYHILKVMKITAIEIISDDGIFFPIIRKYNENNCWASLMLFAINDNNLSYGYAL